MPIKKEVSIAIPCAQVVEPKTLQSMMTLTASAIKNGITIIDIGITERAMIDDARNTLTETFLKTKTEWLFWMDSDMVFSPDTLIKLFETAEKKDAKLVTGIYYQRKGMNYPCLWSRGEELDNGDITGMGSPKSKTNKYVGTFIFPYKEKQEPFQVHAAGFGCVLVHRSVLEVMPRPWFQFLKGQCSEDFYFFVNAAELGFKVWADPRINLWHLGDAPMIGKEEFWQKALKENIEVNSIKK